MKFQNTNKFVFSIHEMYLDLSAPMNLAPMCPYFPIVISRTTGTSSFDPEMISMDFTGRPLLF